MLRTCTAPYRCRKRRRRSRLLLLQQLRLPPSRLPENSTVSCCTFTGGNRGVLLLSTPPFHSAEDFVTAENIPSILMMALPLGFPFPLCLERVCKILFLRLEVGSSRTGVWYRGDSMYVCVDGFPFMVRAVL